MISFQFSKLNKASSYAITNTDKFFLEFFM